MLFDTLLKVHFPYVWRLLGHKVYMCTRLFSFQLYFLCLTFLSHNFCNLLLLFFFSVS